VPTTYFIGEFDPATPKEQGLNHFRNAQSLQKQALIMAGGGHMPNIEKVMEASYCNPTIEKCERYQQQLIELYIFEKAARGLVVSQADLDLFNNAGSSQWFFSPI
jgi:hypothetical protein